MENFELNDDDKDYFYNLYFNIRKMYNILLRNNDKDNSECRIDALILFYVMLLIWIFLMSI